MNLNYEIKQKVFPLIQDAEMEIVDGNFGGAKEKIQEGYKEIQTYENRIKNLLLNKYKSQLKELEEIVGRVTE